MADVYVAAGSNAEPVARLRAGVAALALGFGPVRCSAVYRSPAVGAAAPDYLNLVVAFATAAGPDEVKARLRAIEAAGGRSRDAARSGICALDLDLALYGRRVDAARDLPHADVARRAFVLAPLAELAPRLSHPVSGETFASAWARLAPRAAELVALGPLESVA